MSFGGRLPNQLVDNDVERRIEEELRARQQNKKILNATRALGSNGYGGGATADHAFMSTLMAEQSGANSYYAAAQRAHSFARPGYGNLGQPQSSAAFGLPHNVASDPAVAVSLYARQHAQQQAYGYGGADRYGYVHHDMYSQHFAAAGAAAANREMSMVDHRHGAYGHQVQQQQHPSSQARREPHDPIMMTSPSRPSPKAAPATATPSNGPTSSTKTPASGTSAASIGSPDDLASTLSYMSKGTPRNASSPNKSTPASAKTPASASVSAEFTTPATPATPMSTTSTTASSPSLATSSPKKGPPKPSPDKSSSSETPRSDKKMEKEDEETMELEDLKIDKWYSGCVPLGLEDDKYWLSELQVYLRANFAEAFGATEDDIAAPMHGRNKPIALGQVGIRCMHCKHENPAERGQQATSYPSLISGIYNSVQQMLRLHLDCCQAMPPGVRNKIESLKVSSSSRGGRKQYWIDSAKRLGLVDTRHGIHFGRDPTGPLPPLTGPSVNSKEGRKKKEAQKKEESLPPVSEEFDEPPAIVDDRPLVFPEDQSLISDYLYVTLEQMAPCVLMECDRVGCYKGRKVGFPGLACKHCVGQAGCGRYFPASEASLSQTTTSQTIMNHVRNCRRCPVEIRENLEIMKRARMGPDGKRADKPKHGGRKVFFHRLWCRIQGLPIEDVKEGGKEKKKRFKRPGKKPKKKPLVDPDAEMSGGSDDEMNDDDEARHSSCEEETETESSGDDSEDDDESSTKAASKGKLSVSGKKKQTLWYDGCVRLAKTDDTHWLSEMQCFARTDLVEVFSWRTEDGLAGYSGRKEPADGQVGIRCVFSKNLPDSEKPTGCITFPENLEQIHTKVTDMLRLHFHSCPSMPDDVKETFKTLKNFGPKVTDDSQQYWVDSARDIGVASIPPGGLGNGWGITFRRDPLQPSPCDELDRETEGGDVPNLSNLYLIRLEDRGLCTDQVLLMMRQVKACQFQKRDRRGGPGSRGRDRVLGFPGLACKHCSNKNHIGRYFPVSAKNLTDNTAASLLSHVATCSRCPEPIRASIAYLSHRSILQKAELSGSWKKAFFKKIWERLHTERAWVSAVEDEIDEEEDGGSVSSQDDDEAEEMEEGKTVALGGGDGDSESDEEKEVGTSMNALIKAAAIWLTEQDSTGESGGSRKPAARGRTLPGKRPAPQSPARPKVSSSASSNEKGNSGGKGTSLTSGKRRRVHF